MISVFRWYTPLTLAWYGIVLKHTNILDMFISKNDMKLIYLSRGEKIATIELTGDKALVAEHSEVEPGKMYTSYYYDFQRIYRLPINQIPDVSPIGSLCLARDAGSSDSCVYENEEYSRVKLWFRGYWAPISPDFRPSTMMRKRYLLTKLVIEFYETNYKILSSTVDDLDNVLSGDLSNCTVEYETTASGLFSQGSGKVYFTWNNVIPFQIIDDELYKLRLTGSAEILGTLTTDQQNITQKFCV